MSFTSFLLIAIISFLIAQILTNCIFFLIEYIIYMIKNYRRR